MTATSFAALAALCARWLAAKGRLAELQRGSLAWLHGVSGPFGLYALCFASLARRFARVPSGAVAGLCGATAVLASVLVAGSGCVAARGTRTTYPLN